MIMKVVVELEVMVLVVVVKMGVVLILGSLIVSPVLWVLSWRNGDDDDNNDDGDDDDLFSKNFFL